jgi:hypothetical protein
MSWSTLQDQDAELIEDGGVVDLELDAVRGGHTDRGETRVVTLLGGSGSGGVGVGALRRCVDREGRAEQGRRGDTEQGDPRETPRQQRGGVGRR